MCAAPLTPEVATCDVSPPSVLSLAEMTGAVCFADTATRIDNAVARCLPCASSAFPAQSAAKDLAACDGIGPPKAPALSTEQLLAAQWEHPPVPQIR